MSARQDVFTYLKDNPSAPLDEVLSKFSSAKTTTVRRYFFEYQKMAKKVEKPLGKKKSPTAKSTVSKTGKKSPKLNLKQQVAQFLEQSPNATQEEVQNAFPKAHKATIGNYRRQWVKDHASADTQPPKDFKEDVFKFLDNNPDANINDLKKVFPEAANKLITIFRSWKNDQANTLKTAAKIPEESPTVDKTENNVPGEKPAWIEKQRETIAKQKQKLNIDKLKPHITRTRKPGLLNAVKDFLISKLKKN